MADKIDKLIHEQSRLRIVTYLAGSDKKEVSFNELQNSLDFTSGNLSIQLKKLSEASYIDINKTFKDNKPYTTAALTAKGRNALEKYIEEMENIIGALRK
ncbi:MAG: transcriptional regulator [bacterium]|nr:transcriptional regulator [bacterium]